MHLKYGKMRKKVIFTALTALLGMAGPASAFPLCTDFVVIDGMNRSEFVRLDINEQKDIFVRMSGEQKAALWKYKIQTALEDDRLSGEEKNELKDFAKHLSPEIYETEKGRKKFAKASSETVHKLMTEYGWSDAKVFCILHTWMTEDEIRQYRELHGITLKYPEGDPLEWYEADKWARENIKYYSGNEDGFLGLTLPQQNALYHLFDDDMKARIWARKISDVSRSTVLSDAEKSIVLNLYKEYPPETRPDEMDDMQKHAIEKYKRARSAAARQLSEDFGWDERKFFAYCETWVPESMLDKICF